MRHSDALSSFRSAYLDYLEGAREYPPPLGDLPPKHRRLAESFVESIREARGFDPYAVRPATEELLNAIEQRVGETTRHLASPKCRECDV